MLSKNLNLTAKLATAKKVVLDCTGWDYCAIQVVAPSGTFSILGTNDGGDQTGVRPESPANATNFVALAATPAAGGAAVTAIVAAGEYIINPIAVRYIQLGDGATAAATQLIVHFSKRY